MKLIGIVAFVEQFLGAIPLVLNIDEVALGQRDQGSAGGRRPAVVGIGRVRHRKLGKHDAVFYSQRFRVRVASRSGPATGPGRATLEPPPRRGRRGRQPSPVGPAGLPCRAPRPLWHDARGARRTGAREPPAGKGSRRGCTGCARQAPRHGRM